MKKIVIKDCLECPLVGKCKACKAWKALSPKQRFAIKTMVGASGILKTCHLDDN